ncbi:hypothetical protein Ddye_002071 [Dipteronia dyeriana]|uniref:Uncharacterized protein n=1 Tax=Dipteronia dyeriana TaxID=168575 RepID=A0AAD9XQU3_9ROSI|nr:hypothetical protein Ddye_002071 [Dipteronia dyeriana]
MKSLVSVGGLERQLHFSPLRWEKYSQGKKRKNKNKKLNPIGSSGRRGSQRGNGRISPNYMYLEGITLNLGCHSFQNKYLSQHFHWLASVIFSPLTKVLNLRFLFVLNALTTQATKIAIIFSRKERVENNMTYTPLRVSDLILLSLVFWLGTLFGLF